MPEPTKSKKLLLNHMVNGQAYLDQRMAEAADNMQPYLADHGGRNALKGLFEFINNDGPVDNEVPEFVQWMRNLALIGYQQVLLTAIKRKVDE